MTLLGSLQIIVRIPIIMDSRYQKQELVVPARLAEPATSVL